MGDDISQQINQLKQQFRSWMNGPVSTSLREKGLGYRVIFGVEWPRLVELAQTVGKNHLLAQQLWKEDVRECRLLAGLVEPVEDFYPELADLWVEQMHYPEEAQYTVLSLMQHLPYASEKAFQWVADEREMYQLCGWLLMARLFSKGEPLLPQSEQEFVDQAEAAIGLQKASVRTAARNAVVRYAQIGSREQLRMGKLLKQLQADLL